MADIRQSIVVGAFSSRRQADDAINVLQKAGFQNDQIRHFTGKGAERGPLAGIKNIFTSERMARGDVSRDLMDLGVASEDIPFYQQEYETGHQLVSVSSTRRLPEATAILLNNSAYIPTAAHMSTSTGGRMGQRDTQAFAGQEQSHVFSSQEQPHVFSSQEQPQIVPGLTPVQERTRSISEQEQLRREPFDTTQASRESFEGLQAEQHMRLHAEQIQAYKQPVQIGEVVLRKEIVTDQQTIDVPVSHEEVVIERRPVGSELISTEERLGDGQTIRIPVNEDRINLTKRIVATGDVVVGKRERQEIRHFSDIVQREEAHWEQKGDAHIIWERGSEPSSPPQRGI
ncbi:MAG: YsnF/AvaK domain-containing protein [Ktedonobacteraceae bacterium]